MQKILVIEKDLQKFIEISKYYEVFLCQTLDEAEHLIEIYNIRIILIRFSKDTHYLSFIDELKIKYGIYEIAVLDRTLTEKQKQIILSRNIDDFIYEPIDYVELDFVVRKLLQVDYKKNLYIKDIIIDSDEYIIKSNNISISIVLPNKEFQLLHLLFAYPGRLFSKEELLNIIWCDKLDSDDNTVRTHINRLRKKIQIFSNIEIETVKCLGYKGVIKDK